MEWGAAEMFRKDGDDLATRNWGCGADAGFKIKHVACADVRAAGFLFATL